MAVQGSVKDYFTFIGGLNTEGGFFVTPENSWKDGTNIIPQLDGAIHRRNGIDYEDTYQLYASSITSDQKDLWAFSTGIWSTVGGNGNLNFLVVQTGSTLHFYGAGSGTISATKKSFTVNLSSYTAFGNTETAGTAVASYASTFGQLIVTTRDTNPIRIEYDATSDTITVTQITLEIRDFEGFKSYETITTELTSSGWDSSYSAQGLSDGYERALYNLYNQGWNDAQINSYKAANSNKLPANSKSWIFGKDSSDNFDPATLNKQEFGTSPAPKGKTILSAFKQDRTAGGVTITTSSSYRPTACAFFAGRVWYGGVQSANQLGKVYFSQVLDTLEKAGNCYQANDPTAEVVSDLLDSDGGVIDIPEAGEIVNIVPLARGILILATNGVWFISGIDNAFSASTYVVERITSVGCISAKSVTAVENTVMYWSNNGIYLIGSNNTGVGLTAQNVSDKNIKTFYQNIPSLNKTYAESSYSATDKIVYWLYSSEELTNASTGRFNKNTILALDLNLQSWYWFDLDTSAGPVVVSIETSRETNELSFTYNVISGADQVITNVSDIVQADLPVTANAKQVFKFLTLHPVTSNNYSLTFSDLLNTRNSSTKFFDWYSYDSTGVEKQAYFYTGYQLADVGPARTKTGMYLTMFMKRTETEFDASAVPLNQSSCKMQSRWDFTDNSVANKWAAEVQVYRQPRVFLASPGEDFDDGYPLVVSKNKLRGRGKAVQFKFASEEGYDMQIVGWTGTFIGATNV